jgi:hypothetical protein
MNGQVISIFYKGEEYTFRLKVNDQKAIRNWITIKMVPSGEKLKQSFELINNDHATIVWNQFADHFYSSNNSLMLNDELMELFKQKIQEHIIISQA